MKKIAFTLLVAAANLVSFAAGNNSLANNFVRPPADARPWVYWFWNNGNVTSNGITADLEAMDRVGIGGVLIMDVFERFAPPRGTAEFMNPEWQRLFQFSVQEAARLGLEINMANGPGWCGSSGPWITPELSMQKLVWRKLSVTGPTNFSGELPKPDTGSGKQGKDKNFDSTVKYDDFYRDIAVLAFPDTTNEVVLQSAVINLSAKLDASGKLTWKVPPGRWIIQRLGHTTTGSSTRPPVAGGNGLECDKLSAAAMDAHFAGMMGKLIQTAGPLAGKSLAATHIDSWEVGSQNWTPKFQSEFKKRRGYDLVPWLPCLTEVVQKKEGNKTTTDFLNNFDGAEVANRFRWDFGQTTSELLAENYSGRIAELAHQHGLRYSLEGYNLPFGDEFTYTARADEPMTEFWTKAIYGQNETYRKAQEMASVAHVYGHAIVGAEAFTSGDQEMWKLTPADIKSLGDFEFSQGVNRFVVHRYAHQPYLDRAPGATMGPWGLHYERTQTWWEMSGAWHEYVARCQYLLRQGKFVADLCYLRPEVPNQTYFTPNPPPPSGYRYDEISAEALIQRMSVKDGKLLLPDGMSYRALILPERTVMTPALAEKIKSLVAAGATVLGPRPEVSPSLQNYPKCDEAVARIGNEVWGNCDGKKTTSHTYGKGKVVFGQSLEKVLADLQTSPDFQSGASMNWIHRTLGDMEIFFVANPSDRPIAAQCRFRVHGLAPEFWNPQTGEMTGLAMFENTPEGIVIPVSMGPSDSGFFIFRKPTGTFDPVVRLTRDGQPVFTVTPLPVITIAKAEYGVPGDAARSRDLRAKLQAMVNRGDLQFQVGQLADGDDPAYGIVKTVRIEYTIDGVAQTLTGDDPDTLTFTGPTNFREPTATVRRDARGELHLVARESGNYEIETAGGRKCLEKISNVPAPLAIEGPWQLSFPPNWGAPPQVTLTNLISWTDSANDGIKLFSGTATYRADFTLPDGAWKTNQSRRYLELGDVQVMARVKINGRDCGVAWRPPFRVEVTDALRPGKNQLEIQVANLWPNRLIGDAALAETNRFTWSSWQPFTKDTPLLKSGLLGPVKLVGTEAALVRKLK